MIPDEVGGTGAEVDVHLINPRVLPAGSDGDGLPWLAKRQIGRVGMFVADIA